VEFFGDVAQFPLGPWQLAWVMRVPVVLCFGLYRGGKDYQVSFELLTQGLEGGRRERGALLLQSMQHYARRLEHHAALAPYNWFNFYDFWADESSGDN
jgi:predicted LPLAT superfamily acyltransferase